MNNFRFSAVARRIAALAGRPATFLAAVSLVVLWAFAGPIFNYSDGWQLTINTATTIVTFLMVFLIQNTQNRDTEAMQIKLDELIRATQGAHNALLALEELEDDQLEKYRASYSRLAALARKRLENGRVDTDRPDIKP